MSKAAYVRADDALVADAIAPMLNRWTVMQGQLAAMPEGLGSTMPELRQADPALATLIVSGATSSRVRVDRIMTSIA